jgi:hypothetical protein
MVLLARTAVITSACCLVINVAGCTSPNAPGTSLVAFRPTSPSNGTTFSYYSQPVTLVIASGVATGGTLTSTVEVAIDAAFASIITTQTASSEASGRITIALDHLSPETTYYWRVKTSAGDNRGTVSSTQTFRIGPLLVIQAPTPIQPLADTFPQKRPTFTVANATHTGPDATLTYRFDIATDSAFTNVVTSGSAPEGVSQTSFIPGVDLTSGATYYWRARATDATKGATGGYSSPQPFTTVFPDDGIYRYILVVNVLPPGCNAPWTFDDALSVNGNTLRFHAPGYGISPGMTLTLQRSGNQLSGTLAGYATFGRFPSVAVFNGSDYSNISSPAVTTGSGDNAGHFAGRFAGVAYFDTIGLASGYCHATIDWMLTPH